MESLLLDNLRKNQTFAAAVKKNSRIDQLSDQVLRAVMFQPNEGERKAALHGLESKIVNYFDKEVQPAARAQGVANAKAVLNKLGPPPDLNDPTLRRQILIDGDLRPKDRLRIVQAIVNDKANTLDNRLTAYWLEPGKNPREKLEQLKALHFEQEKKRLEYERELAAFHAGSESKRPARPRLDFMSKFTSDVKGGVLEQARRSGTDAETETFVKAGESQFSWVTVNASEACPDCKKRQGMTGDSKFWDHQGKPGSGHTVCGTACYCMLVPSRTLTKHPSLQRGLEVPATALPAMPGGVPVAAPVSANEPVAVLPVAPKAEATRPEPIPPKPEPIAPAPEKPAKIVKGGDIGAPIKLANGGEVQFQADPFFDARRHAIVYIDPDKLNEHIQATQPTFFVGAGGKEESAKSGAYEGVEQHIAKGGKLFTPRLSTLQGQTSINDGRHRTAFLIDQGAKSIPVQVPKGEAAQIVARFGPGAAQPKPAIPAPVRPVATPANVDAWHKSLSPQEHEAIVNWTRKDPCTDIRERELTGSIPKPRNKYHAPITEQDYQHYKAAMDRAPDYQGTAYRGLAAVTPEEMKQFEVGKEMTWESSSSMTKSRDVGEGYTQIMVKARRDAGGESVVLRITAKSGVDISPIDGDPTGNEEVVARPGSRYKVVKVEEPSQSIRSDEYKFSVRTIHLEEI